MSKVTTSSTTTIDGDESGSEQDQLHALAHDTMLVYGVLDMIQQRLDGYREHGSERDLEAIDRLITEGQSKIQPLGEWEAGDPVYPSEDCTER